MNHLSSPQRRLLAETEEKKDLEKTQVLDRPICPDCGNPKFDKDSICVKCEKEKSTKTQRLPRQ